MSFIELSGLGDAKEREHAPKGRYDLRITDASRYTKEDTGNEVFKLTVEVDGANFRSIRHYLSLPGPNDDEDKVSVKLLMLKRFLAMAGIPFEANGFDEEALYGASWNGEVDVEETIGEDKKPTGRFRNNLVVPFAN